MNKVLTLSIVALFASVPLVSFAAESTCNTVKADISAKIIKNGVPEYGFELNIIPEAQSEQSEGKVVGSCDNGTQRVVYIRHANIDSSITAIHQPAGKPKVENTKNPALQSQSVQ